LKSLPLDLADCFDVVKLDYVNAPSPQKQIILADLEHKGEKISEDRAEKVVDIVSRTREHSDVERGVSTRGMINYAHLLASFPELGVEQEERMLQDGALISLPHRLGLSPEVDLPGKREQIIHEVVDEVVGLKKAEEELVTISKEDILSLVEEIVKEDSFRIPLKYGAFDLLLKRIQNFPQSKLAQLYKEAREHLQELYPERYRADNVTEELLLEFEEERKRDERLKRLLEEEALVETLKLLEQTDILERSSTGWGLSQRGITFLLEKLTPKLAEDNYFYGYGKHSTGKKSALGEGKVIGSRHFRFGDRYRDISLKDTMREVIRNRREGIEREDIMVVTRDVRTKMNIVLLIDLSGTMRQLQKLWYAKQSAIVLTLATSRYGDNVGIVSFSNLADIVVDLSNNPYKVTRKVLDLELHENAFTNIGFGISKACILLAHHPKGKAKQHIILISDGDATAPHPSPPKYALRQAAAAARQGISISSVCIAQQTSNPELMRRIAKIGKGRTYCVGAEELTPTLLEEAVAARAA
jgi:Mg-chelatase subunit ChlD